jgi:glutathione S-transferase
MQLYYFRTMNPRKAVATARQIGTELDYIEMTFPGIKAADYLGINPNGRVPALVDGDVTLWESAAICAYLCRKAGSDLWPEDMVLQADCLRWISWTINHWQRPVGTFYFEHGIKSWLNIGPPDEAAMEAAKPELAKVAAILDAHLAGKDHIACGHLTIADFIAAAMLPGWQDLHMPLQPYANIRRWHDEVLMALPAWADPWPAKAAEAAE